MFSESSLYADAVRFISCNSFNTFINLILKRIIMAQIFKSKDLTFSIPEKDSGERLACTVTLTITHTIYSPICNQPCICTHHTPYPTWCNWTTWTIHSPYVSPYVNVCTGFSPPILTGPTVPQPTCSDPVIAVDNITDIETLKALTENLKASIKDVEGRLAELSKTK